MTIMKSVLTKFITLLKYSEELRPVEAFGDVQKLPFVACGPLHVLLHRHWSPISIPWIQHSSEARIC